MLLTMFFTLINRAQQNVEEKFTTIVVRLGWAKARWYWLSFYCPALKGRAIRGAPVRALAQCDEI
jgi:hypothetical protein